MFYSALPYQFEFRLDETAFGVSMILLHQARSAFTTSTALLLGYAENEFYASSLEVLDKTGIKEVVNCDDDPEYDEDSCLRNVS